MPNTTDDRRRRVRDGSTAGAGAKSDAVPPLSAPAGCSADGVTTRAVRREVTERADRSCCGSGESALRVLVRCDGSECLPCCCALISFVVIQMQHVSGSILFCFRPKRSMLMETRRVIGPDTRLDKEASSLKFCFSLLRRIFSEMFASKR